MKKFGIVVSEFNEMLTEAMLEACLKGFKEEGIEPEILKVPGAAEIPIAAQDLIKGKGVHAIVALGIVIKGETEHYESVCKMCSDGVLQVSLKHHVPIIFEVIMTDSYQKAEKRTIKAYHAAKSAVKIANSIGLH